MVWNLFSSRKSKLTLEETLKEANLQLDTAITIADPKRQILACNGAKTLIKKAEKLYNSDRVKNKGQDVNVANAYHKLATTLDSLEYRERAMKCHTKAKEWGYIAAGTPYNKLQGTPVSNVKRDGQVATLLTADSGEKGNSIPVTQVTTEAQKQPRKQIFQKTSSPSIATYSLPEPGERITSTPQLAYCLGVLQSSFAPNKALGSERKHAVATDPDEQLRLRKIATNVIQWFIQDGLKGSDAVAEVVCLAAVLDEEESKLLLNAFVNEINQSVILNENLLNGLSHLIRNAPSGYIDSDSLVKILALLSARLQGTHQKSNRHIYRLAQAISNILDSMVDSQVEGLKRDQLRAPLSGYLDTLQSSLDPHLAYQAAYAYQAIQYISDDEPFLQEALRRTGSVVHGISGVVSSVRAIDISGFISGLIQIREGLSNEGNDKFGAKEAAANLKKDRESLLASVQDGVGLTREWYPALRGLDALLKEGRLFDFERLAWEAPCRNDTEFQWGLCQRLGELVVDKRWDDNTRQGAISFIEALYKDDTNWNLHPTVKQSVFYFLKQLGQSTMDAISSQIQRVIKELDQHAQNAISPVSQADCEDYIISYTMMAIQPPQSSSLLQNALSTPDVGSPLLKMMRNRTNDSNIDVYIAPRAKAHPRATEDFDLTSKVQEFIESDKKVFLILGDSGSGKSTFSRALEIDLWKSYKNDKKLIPLYVHIPTIENPEQNIISKYLCRHNFTDDEIRELKLTREFILICDGYDESNLTRNLYISNELNQGGNWRVKMIIGCRSDHTEDRTMFHPTDHHDKRAARLFEEATIVSFNKDQIQEYVTQYVSKLNPLWRAEDYHQALKEIPNLHDMVSNPFILKIALEVLPEMHIAKEKYSTTLVTRVGLYDKFVIQWLDRSKVRLVDMEKNDDDQAILSEILRTGFQEHGFTYLKELATAIYDKQNGNSVVTYSGIRDRMTWKNEFFRTGGEKSFMVQAVPLFCNGDQFRFIHKSVLEYALTLAVFDPNDTDDTTEEPTAPTNEGDLDSDLDSLMDLDLNPIQQHSLESPIEKSLKITPLGRRMFVKSLTILGFLAERVQQHPVFKQQLFKAIESSKQDTTTSVLAANSITVLVRAGIQFNGADLQGIRIPGADLSNGIFDSAKLEGADLRKVYLRNTWLRQARLDGSNMTGVKFGELPYIQESDSITCCARSLHGGMFATGLSGGAINLYEMQSWSKFSTLTAHEASISSVAFSAVGSLLVSGSMDMSIRVWDIKTGDCIQTLQGHSLWVNTVAFSPVGNLIAAGGIDTAIRVWNDKTGDCILTLEGHPENITGVAFAPTGDHLASGSSDGSIRIWRAEDGECVRTLQGHDGDVLCIVYSPLGDRIISGGTDKTIRMWDTTTGDCIHTLQGHGHNVSAIAYSLDGKRIASGSFDNTVRLWDAESGICINVLQGHGDNISGIIFSQQGENIVSVSQDKTIRVWDIKNGYYTDNLHGHSDEVFSVVHSPNGHLVASGSFDNTVRVWNVNTGVCVHTLHGRGTHFSSVVYSPQSDKIAFGNKGVVQVWSVEKGTCILTLQGHSAHVYNIVYSPKGELIATSSLDKTARVWDAGTGECLHILDHDAKVNPIVFSPQGDRVATGCVDGTVRVWDVNTTECVHTFQCHIGFVFDIVYSPLGDQVISAGDKTIRVWDNKTGECIHTLSGHSLKVGNVVYSPTGDRIATGSGDKTIRVWDVKSGNCISILQGHDDDIASIVFSPQGGRIASGSNDKTARIWDIDSEKCLAIISSFNEAVRSVSWGSGPNEEYIVTGGGDKSVRRWRLTNEGGDVRVNLSWSSSHEGIVAKDTSLKEVEG
ncbi:hypothetical protein BGZ76_009496, partial [Entomortierella beljakovae]